MTSDDDREHEAARWLIAQDDPQFSEEQKEELARWIRQSIENCVAYLRVVHRWRHTAILYRDETRVALTRMPVLDCLFGRVLRDIREERGVSIEDLAERVGLRSDELNKIEGGKRTPALVSVFVLARALGIAPSRLASKFDKAAREQSRKRATATAHRGLNVRGRNFK